MLHSNKITVASEVSAFFVSGQITSPKSYTFDDPCESDPDRVAAALLERSAGASVWVVYSPTYATYEGFCERLVAALGTTIIRSAADQVIKQGFEAMRIAVEDQNDASA